MAEVDLDALAASLQNRAQKVTPDAGQDTPPLADPDPYDPMIERLQRSRMLDTDPGAMSNLSNLAKFTGHGVTSGLAESLGMPVDMVNSAAYYLQQRKPPASPLDKPDKAPPGGAQTFKSLAGEAGLPTSSPEQEGVKGKAADYGYTLGEFAGANIPFMGMAPEKALIGGSPKSVTNLTRLMHSDNPLTATLHDFVYGGLMPGTGAILGGEVAGKDDKQEGKDIGAFVGGLRVIPIELALNGIKKSGTFLYDFLGAGKEGAEKKAGQSIVSSMQDVPGSMSKLRQKTDVSPGAQVPTDIKLQDDGLIALRRAVMAKDAELSGDYRRMQKATERAIQDDAKLSPANFPDAASWLQAKQKDLEKNSAMRLQQAVQQAERDTEAAFKGVTPDKVDANTAKARYAHELRKQLVFAQDEMNEVTKTKWDKVDKSLPVETDPLYDEIKQMQADHKSRPGESDKRFPGDVISRFFDKDKPKFGMGAKLQDMIDLNSEIGQEIRAESAKDAPDRVHLAYLTRLSSAIQNVEKNIPEAENNAALKDALNATKQYHETFTRGPVGQVLGHDVAGAPDIFPGDTIKHFLSQGPGGADNFDALMKGVAQRTGARTTLDPRADMTGLIEKHVKQDFYDTAMANGHFSPRSAERWMANNAGALQHPSMAATRKELQTAIESNGASVKAEAQRKQDIDDIRRSRASVFLNGDAGKLFNGALTGPNQYKAAKELVQMVKDDPTGKASEGLVQMAFDRMIADSFAADRSSAQLQRMNGLKIKNWVDDNAGVIKALDEAIPGTSARFKRISDTAHYLEGFQTSPTHPSKEEAGTITWLRETMARVMGANIGTKVGYGGGSIQTAAIGSNLFKKMAANLTPDEAGKIFRRAMVDPDLFEAITKPITNQNAEEVRRYLQPYFYSMGVPMMQPEFEQQRMPPGAKQAPDGKYYVPDPNRQGKYLRVQEAP